MKLLNQWAELSKYTDENPLFTLNSEIKFFQNSETFSLLDLILIIDGFLMDFSMPSSQNRQKLSQN